MKTALLSIIFVWYVATWQGTWASDNKPIKVAGPFWSYAECHLIAQNMNRREPAPHYICIDSDGPFGFFDVRGWNTTF